MFKLNYFILFLSYIQVGFAQNQPVFGVIENIKNLTFEKNYAILKKAKQPETLYLELLTKIIEDDRQTRLEQLDKRFLSLQNKPNNPTISWVFHLIEGYKYMHYTINSRKSFLSFSKAYDIAKKLNAIEFENFSLLSILKLFSKGIITDQKHELYIKSYKLVCKTNTDWFYYFYYCFYLKSLVKNYNQKSETNLYQKYNKIHEKLDSVASEVDSSKKYLMYYFNSKANVIIKTDLKRAKELYLKSATYFTDSPYFRFRKYINLCNLSRVAALEGEHEKGLTYLNKAKKYVSANDSLQDMHDISVYKAIHFNQMGIHDSAYHHEHQARLLTYALNFQKHNTEITAIKTALDTEKKDKENIALRSKRQQDKALLIGAGTILLLGSGIGYLTITNSRKKRLLAEKQEAIEKQKNLTLLKEQEITIINAMIDGQEKERKLIAEDLHDNIGSVLATLKLHFENLKLNRNKKHFNQKELYDKTEVLIDETYFKIRQLAHAKNSGVLEQQGLVLAITSLAEKISAANTLQVEVIEYGVSNALEISFEITVFRIVQELLTNIIKHAAATKATINISQFEKNLSIIIEDNGIGFDQTTITTEKGMGMASIQKRINHLEGTFTVDSTVGKGTSILIDIPL